ncbi:MAG: chemotaxis protein CheW, partial [Alphaproteobacteria bacterium]|nr:chemotaxis protein CheW [Alphaproteobacteria bacterium]
VEGFLDLAGEIMPVLRLDRLMGLNGAPVELYTPLVVTAAGGDRMALMVDQVLGVATAAIHPVMAGETLNGCVAGVAGAGDAAASLLAIDRILLVLERQRIAAFQREITARQKRVAETGEDA